MCGAEILFAVSAATSLAVEVANKYNITLVGFVAVEEQRCLLIHND